MIVKEVKRLILIAALFCVVSQSLCCAQATDKTSDEQRIKAVNILDKFAQNQEKFRSFILKEEETTKNKISLSGNWKHTSGERTRYDAREIAYDGNRVKKRIWTWGDATSSEHIESREDAKYLSYLWDGSQFMSYQIVNKSHPGRVKIEKRLEQAKVIGKQIAPEGCIPGLSGITSTGERIDLLLKKMSNVHCLNEMEEINKVKCYAIEARDANDSYKVWIDPEHGYNIAKATSKIEIRGTQSETRVGSIKNIRFTQIGKLWVAMEVDVYGRTDYPNGDFMEADVHYKRIKIELNPDHQNLHSFTIDNIRNGARVWYAESMLDAEYTWQDGKIIPKKADLKK